METKSIPEHRLQTVSDILGADKYPPQVLRALLEEIDRPAATRESVANARLLTVTQAAARLACSRRTVLRMADDGRLTRRYLRPGNAKSLRLLSSEIDALCGGEGERC